MVSPAPIENGSEALLIATALAAGISTATVAVAANDDDVTMMMS